jgi:hypothetical protein
MCCAMTKVPRHAMLEPLIALSIWAVARFEAGDARPNAVDETMCSSVSDVIVISCVGQR